MLIEALHLDVLGSALAGFFAIMNPIANTPIFLGLTEQMHSHARRAVATKATLVAFFVVTSFALLGQLIFSVFGITSGAFRVAGGIIVFLIGYRMLQGEQSSLHQTRRAKRAGEAHQRLTMGVRATSHQGEITGEHVALAVAAAQRAAAERAKAPRAKRAAHHDDPSVLSVAVTPLGVPLLAGPGTIATAVGFSAGAWEHVVVTIIAFATLCLGTWLSFIAGERLTQMLGPSVLTVVTRLMGLILAVIGVQMFLHGLKESGF